MDRGVAHDPLEAPRGVDDAPRVGLLVVGLAQLFTGFQALLEGGRAAHDRVGDQLRQAVARPVVVAEHARRVARGGAGEHLAEGDDLRDRLAPVLLGHVAHHALASAHGEVDVDVWHRDPLGVEEALEQQLVAQRVHVGDLQAVRHDRAGRRAAPGAHGDAVLLGVLDEVPDDQEVGVEAHALDHAELHLHALHRLRGRGLAVARAQPLLHTGAQVLALGDPLGGGEARDQLLAELDLHPAALGDLQGVGDRLGPLREGLGHLRAVAQVELVGVEGELGGGDRALGLHAQECGVVVVVLTAQVVHVARAHQAPADFLRDAFDPLVALLLGGESVLLQLEVDVLGAEDSKQLVRVGARVAGAIFGEALAEAGGEAAGERDHPLGVAGDLLEVDGRLAPLQALQEAGGGELDEVAVASVVGGEQREVVALDPSRSPSWVGPLGRIGSTYGGRCVIVHKVDLAADDRLDAVLGARLVQLHRAVHHAVVGQSQGGLFELRGAGGERVDLAGAVE